MVETDVRLMDSSQWLTRICAVWELGDEEMKGAWSVYIDEEGAAFTTCVSELRVMATYGVMVVPAVINLGRSVT